MCVVFFFVFLFPLIYQFENVRLSGYAKLVSSREWPTTAAVTANKKTVTTYVKCWLLLVSWNVRLKQRIFFSIFSFNLFLFLSFLYFTFLLHSFLTATFDQQLRVFYYASLRARKDHERKICCYFFFFIYTYIFSRLIETKINCRQAHTIDDFPYYFPFSYLLLLLFLYFGMHLLNIHIKCWPSSLPKESV